LFFSHLRKKGKLFVKFFFLLYPKKKKKKKKKKTLYLKILIKELDFFFLFCFFIKIGLLHYIMHSISLFYFKYLMIHHSPFVYFVPFVRFNENAILF